MTRFPVDPDPHRPARSRPAAAGTRAMWVMLVATLLGGCAVPSPPAAPPMPSRPIVLFGEVHDNAAQHALRLRAIEAMVRAGARPALLFEQFDRERQGEIDRVRAQVPAPDADALIRAGSGDPQRSGWDWPLYRPLVALALEHGLPIVAANVSRTDTRAILAEGLAARGFDAAIAPDIVEAQAAEIEQGHCGLLDRTQARRMVAAQVARDQYMARMVEAHAERGVVLIAGNGHVRRDVGVPRWLPEAVRAQTESIGLLEQGSEADAGAYDRVVVTARQPRKDPCEGMR